MTAVSSKQAKADEYRRLAQAEFALMEASVLANVREKHEIAAERWMALAGLDDRPATLPVADET